MARKGQWHDTGGRYRIRFGEIYHLDQGGYHTRVEVEVFDTMTGKTENRVGDGRQMGNYHPVWIRWKGKQVQVETLLNQRA